jgi:hypothetical protein
VVGAFGSAGRLKVGMGWRSTIRNVRLGSRIARRGRDFGSMETAAGTSLVAMAVSHANASRTALGSRMCSSTIDRSLSEK